MHRPLWMRSKARPKPELGVSKTLKPNLENEARNENPPRQQQIEPYRSLWDQAYEDLRSDKPGIVEAFEELLMSESEIEPSGSRDDGDTSKREKKMSALVDKKLAIMNDKQWRFKVGDNSVEVREQVDRVVKVVLVAKDILTAVGNLDPIHAGLPLAGVCVLLSLIVNDTKQRADAIAGLEYISNLVRRYSEIEQIYLQGENDTLSRDLGAAIRKLYCQILEFQARAACQFSRNTALQILRNIVQADGWKDIKGGFEISEKECGNIMQVTDARDERTRAKQLESILKKQTSKVDELLRISRQEDDAYAKLLEELKRGREEQKAWRLTDDECKCHQVLRTSQYEEHKARNPDRVDGTCQWFLKHPIFRSWLESGSSSLVWVSADPGCGKSVLSKSLIDRELLSTESRTTCYFFFKDDNIDQKSITKALCALLHQLFSQNNALVKYALPEFKSEGDKLPQNFSKLWNILTKAVTDPNAGEVICVLDALDECEESGRFELINSLKDFYLNISNQGKQHAALKFLVTSRPYFDIERSFKQLTRNLPTIRLAGEEELESISSEINLVIKARVEDLGSEMDLNNSVQSALEEELLKVTHRTYLWLHLILEVIRCRLDVTENKLRKTIGIIPATVENAYEAILAKSKDRSQTEKLLHIVVSAIRPLTLKEMNIALAMETSSKSYEDLDLEDEAHFKTTVRNLCGLFVSIIDGKIYLIHQTAKEFLISKKDAVQRSSMETWKHSLHPKESDFVLAEICISYLLFDVFNRPSLAITKKRIQGYVDEHDFLDYSAKHWATHFRDSESTQTAIVESVLEVCDARSTRFELWFQLYWNSVTYLGDYPLHLTDLMLGSCLGHNAVVKLLLKKGVDLEAKDENGTTALIWAIRAKNEVIVKLLLEKGADLEAKDNKNGRTALIWAIRGKNEVIVKLLLEKGADLEAKDNENGRTALIWAIRKKNEVIVKLLLEKGADLEAKDDKEGRTALIWAIWWERNETIVKLLLENGASLEVKDDEEGMTVLMWAIWWKKNEIIVKLLLEKGASLEAKDNKNGRTALILAIKERNEVIVKLLLEKGADLEAKDDKGKTALIWAIRKYEKIVKLLLEKGADLEAKDSNGWTALIWAIYERDEVIVKLLLEKGANLEAKDDEEGMTVLMWTIWWEKNETIVKLLLENGASLEVKDDEEGMTVLMWAIWWKKNEIIVKLLLEKGADLEAKGNDGQTALQLATERGYEEMVKMLILASNS